MLAKALIFMMMAQPAVLCEPVSDRRFQAQVVLVTPLGLLPMTHWFSYET